MSVELHMGDCLEVMHSIEDASVDMILADLPYGTTECKWDAVISLTLLWEQYTRLLKRNGTVVLFGSQPFTSVLVMSNPAWFRYEIIWRKTRKTGFANARFMPLKEHENILVFAGIRVRPNQFVAESTTYNPQGICKYNGPQLVNRRKNSSTFHARGKHNNAYTPEFTNFPTSTIEIPSEAAPLHPTQKPVALMEYLIKTYTNEGETVLDNTMGSGTTGVACINTNRHFIGIEKDEGYFQIATERIQKAQGAYRQAELIGA